MPSTKYPLYMIGQPWIAYKDLQELPYQIYPNWRPKQRPPAPTIEEDSKRHWHSEFAKMGHEFYFWLDFDFCEFLASVTGETMVILMTQGYDGKLITTEVVRLSVPYWCDSVGASIARLDYTIRGIEARHWSPLVLAIAPIDASTPYFTSSVINTTTAVPPREELPFFQILKEYGLPKGEKVSA